MSGKFDRLEDACGGSINPDTLGDIANLLDAANATGVDPFDAEVIRQYREFMRGAREMFFGKDG